MNTQGITTALPQTEPNTDAEPGAVRLPVNHTLLESRLRFGLFSVAVLLMIWLTVSVITSITEFEATLDGIRSLLAAPSFNL